MRFTRNTPVPITAFDARRIWLNAQRLDQQAPFGRGAAAVQHAVEHLGYVQIDTINVVERCHHHILFSRIPEYRRSDLLRAQTIDKTVFEYWTHALSYVPSRDIRYFLGTMRRHWRNRSVWFSNVRPADMRKVLTLLKTGGALTIRDIDDDVLIDKYHAWASRKPSKRALQLAFYRGDVTISRRAGMLKTYELMDRHFGWDQRPKAAAEGETANYVLDRALRSQGLVSLESVCHLDAPRKPVIEKLIEARVRKGMLIQVHFEGASKTRFWAIPTSLSLAPAAQELTHILSPFDPLIIQRKRLKMFFGYEHKFEAYIPKDKRSFGYFALPVLVGDVIVAAIDLKTDRAKRELLIQQWTWVGNGTPELHKRKIEEQLHRFERFQLLSDECIQ